MAIGNPITLTNNVASKNISVTATADQTLFTVTGGYRINQLAVFRNGVRLVDGADFTARDGSTVTLVTAANLNDTIEFQIFEDFRVADAIVSLKMHDFVSRTCHPHSGLMFGARKGTQVLDIAHAIQLHMQKVAIAREKPDWLKETLLRIMTNATV